ncbi:hypothetical protein [Nocardia pseudobrasiliensis]|uniref:hypothetical protein n=1 Tax=Nocardia pseudobrasiliensis TaxID=45979 RepID=UPI00082EE38F|nr:hypothetical protein [Nocardia pseudobrasiliensis]
MGADADLAQSGDVDHILDVGAPGLRYFEHYLPLLDEATSTCGTTYQDVCAKYDAQRNMKLAVLSTVADGLKKALAAADTEWETHNTQARTLPSVWQGEAATAATEMMRGLITRSNEDRIAARNALGAIETAIPALKLIIAGKANAVRALWDRTGGRIDGKTPGQIYDIVQGAKNSGMGANPFDSDQRIDHLKAMFPGIDKDDIPNKCSEWLKGPFQQDVKDKLDIFERACANCHTGVEGLYKVITDALAQVSDAAYPKAEAQKRNVPPQPGLGPGPGPATTTPPETTPTSPTSATPSATPISSGHDGLAQPRQAGSALSGVLQQGMDQASQALGEAGSALSGVLQQGMDQASQALGEAGSALSGVLQQGMDQTSQALGEAGSALSGVLQQGADQVSQALSQAGSAVPSALPQEAGLGQAGSALSDALRQGANQAGQALSQAGSALPDALQEAVDQAARTGSTLSGLAHQTADAAMQSIAPLAPTDGIHAELDVAGNHLRLDADPTGELHLTTSRADNDATTYTLRLDEHGVPVIIESKPAETEHDPSDPSDADRESRTSETRAGGAEDMSPVPEDGEERRSEPPSGTGPDLAEAGPL